MTLFSLLLKDINAHRLTSLMVVVAVAISTCMLHAVLWGGAEVSQFLSEQATSLEQRGDIVVKPKLADQFFGVTKQVVAPLTQEIVEQLGQQDTIASVYTELLLPYPTSVRVGLFNTTFESDAPVYGVRDELFNQKSIQDKTMPVLLSQQLLDFYNLGLAPAIGKPLLSEELLKNMEFDLRVGYSSFFGGVGEQYERIQANVVGVSNQVPLFGISIPMSRLETLHNKFVDTEPEYSSLYVTLTEGADLLAVIDSLRHLGFDATSTQEQVAPLQQGLAASVIVVGVFAMLVLLLVYMLLFTIFVSRFLQSKKLLSMMLVLGGTIRHLRSFLIVQVVLLTITGYVIGSVTVFALVQILSAVPLAISIPSLHYGVMFVLMSATVVLSLVPTLIHVQKLRTSAVLQ